MKWLFPFAPDEFIGPLVIIALLVAGCMFILGMRIAGRAWLLCAVGLVFAPVLLEALVMPIVEDLLAQLSFGWTVLLCVLLAVMLFFGLIGALFGQRVREQVVGDLLSHAIIGTIKLTWNAFVALPLRLIAGMLRRGRR
jgi:hypothetical protein